MTLTYKLHGWHSTDGTLVLKANLGWTNYFPLCLLFHNSILLIQDKKFKIIINWSDQFNIIILILLEQIKGNDHSPTQIRPYFDSTERNIEKKYGSAEAYVDIPQHMNIVHIHSFEKKLQQFSQTIATSIACMLLGLLMST
jgi:hypothetical protein